MYPYSSSEFGRSGYKSSYLTWNSDDSEDMGFYVEPPSYFQEDYFYKSGCYNYRDGGGYDVNEHDDSSYQDSAQTHNASGSANLLGDYFSHFVWDEAKFSEGCDAFDDNFNGFKVVKDSSDFVSWDEYNFSEGCDGLDMVKDPYRDKEVYDSYGSSEKGRETQFRAEHIPWFDGDFGFQYWVDEDHAAELKSKYNQSSESWDETGLYEKIFGNWHNMLRSDTESRAEAENA